MPDVTVELNYDDAASIPEGFAGLYDEVEGKFVLAGVSGMKTQADITNVQEALRKEREDHKVAQTGLKAWGDLKPDEVQGQLDRIKELETAAGGKLDDDAINGIVEGRLTQKIAPLERNITTLTETNTALQAENDGLKSAMERRDMNEAVRGVAVEMKVHTTAIADVEMIAAAYLEKDETTGQFITKADVQGVTPGVDVKQFMKEMQKMRPHWWPASEGGGAGGGAGLLGGDPNPWSHDGWNLTKQGAVHKEQGAEIAAKLAKAAGTTVGGLRPPAKK